MFANTYRKQISISPGVQAGLGSRQEWDSEAGFGKRIQELTGGDLKQKRVFLRHEA